MIYSRKSIGGVEVRPGAVWTMHLQNLRFRGQVRCLSAEPESYVAELILGGKVLMTTDPQTSYDKAERALQQAVFARVAALLGE